jgi:hypothetical protein
VNAYKHGTRNVERFSQGSSDLVWMMNSEARRTEFVSSPPSETVPLEAADELVVLSVFSFMLPFPEMVCVRMASLLSRAIQSHVRLQSTANILCSVFSAASVNWGVGVVSLDSGTRPAVDTASTFRLTSHITHLRRALTQTPLPI